MKMFQSKTLEKPPSKASLPTVDQITPLDPETNISPLLYMPVDIWKYLTSYLSLNDKASLRLVCQFFFRAILSNLPTWEQWVCAKNIDLFRRKGKALGWGDRSIYGVLYPPEVINKGWYIPPLYALDLSNYHFLTINKEALISNSFTLPQELIFLKLAYFSNITEDFLKLLFQKYPDLYVTFQDADLLWWACYFGWKEIITIIFSQIEAKKGPFSKVDINGSKSVYSPLAIAAQRGYIEIIELLLKQGADINYSGNSGPTPLMVATQKGNFQVVKLLLQHGANPDKPNKENQTPLTMTQLIKDDQTRDVYDAIAKLLIAFGANYSSQDTDEKMELLESLLASKLENKEKFLQEALETHAQLPQPLQILNPVTTEIIKNNKQFIYELSIKIASPNNREVRLMAHQIALWLEYIFVNNFIFSVPFCREFCQLFSVLLIDYYLEDFDALRKYCPTQNILNLTLNVFQQHEFYQLRSDIQGLQLRKIVKIKPPLFMLEKTLSLLPQAEQIHRNLLMILDLYTSDFCHIFKPKDKLAAAMIAVARYCVLGKDEETWFKEYADKTNLTFQSFKEYYDVMYSVAYKIYQNKNNLALKNANVDPNQVATNSNNNSQPSNTSHLQPSNSNSNNNSQQLATHPANFFNQANIKQRSASSDNEKVTEELTKEMEENDSPKNSGK